MERKPDWLVIAIAGIVANQEVKITQVDWPVVRASEVAEQLGIPEVRMINDFEANGYGV